VVQRDFADPCLEKQIFSNDLRLRLGKFGPDAGIEVLRTLGIELNRRGNSGQVFPTLVLEDCRERGAIAVELRRSVSHGTCRSYRVRYRRRGPSKPIHEAVGC